MGHAGLDIHENREPGVLHPGAQSLMPDVAGPKFADKRWTKNPGHLRGWCRWQMAKGDDTAISAVFGNVHRKPRHALQFLILVRYPSVKVITGRAPP